MCLLTGICLTYIHYGFCDGLCQRNIHL
ncbi:conjugal transfer protein TrbH, partial [Salmonella enterica subsp. enterica serovar Typhimurium]